MAGVSRGTVDRVLNNRGYVNAETAEKVKNIAKELNYTPNHIARALSIKKNNIKIGVILVDPENKYFDDVICGIDTKAKELEDAGCQVIMSPCRMSDAESQIQAIDDLLEQNIQGLIISPNNSKRVADKLNDLHEKNIPVITTNTDINHSQRLCYVGSNYYVSGKAAGTLMGLITGGRANVGIISGYSYIQCHEDRIMGFRNKISKHHPEIHIIDTVENHDDEFESYAVTQKLLKAHPEITALYLSAGGVYGACRAVADEGLAGKLKIICYDDVPNTRKMILDDIISVTICQEPFKQGALPVEILFEYLAYGIQPKSELNYTDIIIKIKDNL